MLIGRRLAILFAVLPSALPAADLAVIAIHAPNSGCALGSQETVIVRVHNYGDPTPMGHIYQLYLTVDGGTPVQQAFFMGNAIRTNGVATFNTGPLLDLSAPGDHVIDARISVDVEVNSGNDAFIGHLVRNDAPTIAGTISAPAVALDGSGMAQLSGSNGTVLEWQQSTDGARWNTLQNTSLAQGFAGLTQPTWFRVLARNGRCTAVATDAALVQPNAIFANGFES